MEGVEMAVEEGEKEMEEVVVVVSKLAEEAMLEVEMGEEEKVVAVRVEGVREEEVAENKLVVAEKILGEAVKVGEEEESKQVVVGVGVVRAMGV